MKERVKDQNFNKLLMHREVRENIIAGWREETGTRVVHNDDKADSQLVSTVAKSMRHAFFSTAYSKQVCKASIMT